MTWWLIVFPAGCASELSQSTLPSPGRNHRKPESGFMLVELGVFSCKVPPHDLTNLYKLWKVVHVLDADASHGVRLLVQEELLHDDVVR